MNRYQLEIADMDRRQRRIVRSLSFGGVAALIIGALWAGGFAPANLSERLAALWRKFHSSAETGVPVAAPNGPAVASSAVPLAASEPAVASLPGTESSISEQPMPLHLVSTSPGSSKNEGSARLGTHPQNPQTYAAGATLMNGARIAEIHADHIVLERDGRTAKLYVDGKQQARNAAADLLQVGGEQPKLVQAPPRGTRLVDYFRPSPVFDGEVLRGYVVYPGAKSGVFFQLGLQAGDVITAINGVPLSEAETAVEALQQLTQGAATTATVERRGKRQQISLDGSAILADQERARQADSAGPDVSFASAPRPAG